MRATRLFVLNFVAIKLHMVLTIYIYIHIYRVVYILPRYTCWVWISPRIYYLFYPIFLKSMYLNEMKLLRSKCTNFPPPMSHDLCNTYIHELVHSVLLDHRSTTGPPGTRVFCKMQCLPTGSFCFITNFETHPTQEVHATCMMDNQSRL